MADTLKKGSVVVPCVDYPGVCKILKSNGGYGTGFLSTLSLNGKRVYGNHVLSECNKELVLEFHFHLKASDQTESDTISSGNRRATAKG